MIYYAEKFLSNNKNPNTEKKSLNQHSYKFF